MEENLAIPFEEFQYPANFEIPFDLFISKKYEGLGARGFLRFTDSAGNSVYTVKKSSHKPAAQDSPCTKLVLDSSGNTLFSIHRLNVSWLSDFDIVLLLAFSVIYICFDEFCALIEVI